MLWDTVEGADEVVVDGGEVCVVRVVVEVGVELLPQVGDGKLAWVLRKET